MSHVKQSQKAISEYQLLYTEMILFIEANWIQLQTF